MFSTSSEYFSLWVLAPSVAVAYLFYWFYWIVYSRFFHPYHDIPGPFLASITRWWRWHAVRYGVGDDLQHALHERYGPLVRITPDEVSISDPHAIDMISRPDFLKTDYYTPFDPGFGGRPEPFATRDERVHTQHKKIISPLFRSDIILDYEVNVDGIQDIFDERMQTFADSKKIFDLADSINRYTWDTVGDMLYAKAGGFGMLRGNDYMGWMQMIRVMPQPISSLGYVPYGFSNLHFMLMLIFSPQTRNGLMSALKVRKQVQELVKHRKDQEASGSEFRTNDMLSKMIAMTRDEKVDFNEDDIAIILNAFVWAGSDTSGSSISMIMYFILSTPRVHKSLLSELRPYFQGSSRPTYTTLSKLSYLTACINEGLRLHFILGVGLPRCIPPQGVTILNRHFPGNRGLKVLANMPVMQTSPEVFGADAKDFRPERWLDADEKKVAQMTKYFHPFGIGVRVCAGKWIAMLEIYKFVAESVTKWEFEKVEDEKEGGGKMTVARGHLQQPEGLMVRVKRRQEKS